MQGEKKIVAIGGGHGLEKVLYGLRNTPYDITAIVTPFDSGGSTGTLREHYQVLSAGDYTRACMALSELPEWMKEILDYKFDSGPYNGHSTRNALFTAACVWLAAVQKRGLEGAMSMMKTLYQMKENHNVYLSSTVPGNLCAIATENGEEKTLIGETVIDTIKPPLELEKVFLQPIEKDGPIRGYDPAIKAIEEADMIILGPGSLFTSIVPNLLVDDIPEAIYSSEAIRVYIPNIMTENGHTDGLSISDHIKIIQHYGLCHGGPDVVLVNTKPISDEIREVYETEENKLPVEYDEDKTISLVDRVIEGDFLTEGRPAMHDPQKIAGALEDILLERTN